MNMKRTLVLFLTLVMLVSAFTPALNVFANTNDENDDTKTKLNYVSLGDSMTNGIGMDGYDSTVNEKPEGYEGNQNNGHNGYLEIAPDSYPAKIQAWLESYKNADVELTQLATSAVRVEDILYILNRGTNNQFDNPDHWTEKELLWNRDRWGDPYGKQREFDEKHIDDNDAVAEVYQNAIANADIISLAAGNGNFGVYLIGRIMGIAFGDSEELEEYEFMTFENALAMCEGNEEFEELVTGVYNDMLTYLENMGLPMEMINLVLDRLTYVTTSFVISYYHLINCIVELNTKKNLEIIVLPLMNNLKGFKAEVAIDDMQFELDFGGMLDMLYQPLNAYIAGVATARQAAEAEKYDGVTFYYVEYLDAIETFGNASDVLYAPVEAGVTSETYPQNRYFSHTRFIPDLTGWVFDKLNLPAIVNAQFGGFGINYEEFTADDVKTYEIAVANGDLATLASFSYGKLLSIGIYLGFVDAIITSMETNPVINQSIVLPEGAEPTVMNYITAMAVGPITNAFTEFGAGLAIDPVQALINAPETFATNLTSSGAIEALLSLYGRMKMADGLNSHPTAAGHDTITASIKNAYETKWTVQKQTIKNAYELALEYYDEAYAFGYQYADENGYIDLSVEAIDKAIAALEGVDVSVLGTTEELAEKLEVEIEALIETLNELREVLATDSAKDVEGLVAAVFALEDDLYTHLNNIYAVLAQAGIDVNQLVILPALAEALYILETEVIPAALAAAEAFANAVVEYVTAKVDAAYREVIAILVRIQLHVQDKLTNAVTPIINAYCDLVDTLKAIYGTVEEAIRVANAIFNGLVELDAKLNGALSGAFDKVTNLFVTLYNAYGNVEDALAALNTILMNVVNTTEETIANVIEAYDALVNKLVAIYGTVEEALAKAAEIYNNIVNTVNGTVADALALYNTILNVLVDTYGTVENVVIVAGQLFYHVYDFLAGNITAENLENLFNGIVAVVREAYGTSHDVYYVAAQVYAYILNAYNNAFEGNYIVNDDSMYVSLGSGMYGEELAEMLGLSDKYMNYYLDEEYLDAIAEADLITVKFDNGEALTFIMFNLLDPTELDWDKYLDAQGQVALAALLDELKAEFLANGQMVALSTEILESMGLVSVTLTDEVVAEYMTYAVECLIYCYAEFIDRITVTLGNIYTVAPDATVVITGIQNPLADLGFDLGEYGQIADLVVDGLNLHLIAAALVNDNTIFVESEDAQDIFNALNVVFNVTEEPACNHVYSDCLDTTCNLCGAVRVAGHSFTNYVSNNDASCGKNATKTAKCDNCDATSTIEIPNTALEHVWTEASCKAPKTCTLCGLTDGDLLPHTWGEWTVVVEPTHKVQGFRERKCLVCNRLEAEAIPVLDGLSTGSIVAICIGAVVVLAGVAISVRTLVKKNKKASSKKVDSKKSKK